MGHIISITNNKGGCGKTTTTCNLADALGKKNKTVLVIDLDPQSNTTNRLMPKNTSVRKSLYDFFDIFDNNEKKGIDDISEIIYPTEIKNVDIIPNIGITANLEPAMMRSQDESLHLLRKSMRTFALKNYDITLIDNPPNMGTFVLCSLYSSDFVLIPVKAGSMDSVEGLIKATNLIKKVQEEENPDLKFLRILINCIDKRTAISKAIVTQIRKTFSNDQIFKTEVPVNTTFEKSEASKQTVFKIDGTSAGARSFRQLAKELITILEI